MNSTEANPYRSTSNVKKIDRDLLLPILRNSVTLYDPYTHFFPVFEKQRVILSILRNLQRDFPGQVSSYLGGSSILNRFGGSVYHTVADLDWTIIITPSSDIFDTLNQAQASIIHSLATLLFAKKSQVIEEVAPEFMGVRVTTPLLPDGYPFARYCFSGWDTPLELCLHVRDRPLSRLMYDLFIPLRAFKEGLGSDLANKFELHSSDCTEGIDIDAVLTNISNKVIIYNPEPQLGSNDRNKWLRLLIAITEGSLAPDSDINKNWFEEAIRGDIRPSHVIEWAYYKRPSIGHYPFFLSLNAFLNSNEEHPLTTNFLIETIYYGRFLQGHPLFSWVRTLIDIFELEGAQHPAKIYSISPSLQTLFKLLLPYFSDEALPCRHSHHLHLHLRFGNQYPFFVPLPISCEDRIEFFLQTDLRPLIYEMDFAAVAEIMLESPLLSPREVEALFLLAEKIPQNPFSFSAHIRAALHWKKRKIDLFLLHLSRALDCKEQDLSSCRDQLIQESDPFLFETTASLLQLPHALLLAYYQLQLFGPELPLSFFSSCVKSGITDPIIKDCLKALEVAPPEIAWKAYRELASVPEIAKAIERQHLHSMLPLAAIEPDKEPYKLIIQRRMDKALPKRAFELARLAKALLGESFNPSLYAVLLFRSFPNEKKLILDCYPDLEDRISEEEGRLLLIDKKLSGAALIEALSIFNPASCSIEELSSLAIDTVSKFTQLSFTDFLNNYQTLFSFLKALPEPELRKFLPRWLESIFDHYRPPAHEFSEQFWKDIGQISCERLENTKPWKKLFIKLVISLPPPKESYHFILSLEQATRSISDREFPFILPQANIEKRWFYHFKAICHLRDALPSSALLYLESMLRLPYQKKSRAFLTTFSEDPFNFYCSFENLSSPDQILHLLRYQSIVKDLKELLSFYIAAYKRFPEEPQIVSACSSAATEIIESDTPKIAWEVYPDLHKLSSVAEKIESLDLREVAEREQNKTLYAEIILKRFSLAQQSVKRQLLELLDLLGAGDKTETLLAEDFKQNQTLISGAEKRYSSSSTAIASHLTGAALHHFILLFPEGNRALGWRLFLDTPLACSYEESKFYLESATLEEKCSFLAKLLSFPSPQRKELFDLIVSDDCNLEALLQFENLTSDNLLTFFSLLASRDKSSSSFHSFIKFSLTYPPSYLKYRELLERLSPYYNEENLNFLSERYSKELTRDLAENNDLDKHLLFLLRHKIGKNLQERIAIYPLFLKLAVSTPFQHVEELLRALKKPIKPDFANSPEEILEFKQVMCVWIIYLSSNKRSNETLYWLADKIAFSLAELHYVNLYYTIAESIPQFDDVLINRRISLLNELTDDEASLVNLCSLLPHIRIKDLNPCIKYCTKMYNRFPTSSALILAEKLYYLSISNKQNRAAGFIIKNIIVKHSNNVGITPINAHFYLHFFIHALEEPIDFLWEKPVITTLFLEAATQYLLFDRAEPATVKAILQRLENKHPAQPMLPAEWAIAEKCIELIDEKNEVNLSRSLKTLGQRNSPIDEKVEKKMFKLYPESAPILLANLAHFSLIPENHSRIRDLCTHLNHAPLGAEELFLFQGVIPHLVAYFSSLIDEASEIDSTTQECLQAISFIAFKCDMEDMGREAAALLYRKLVYLNHSHMSFIINHNFHRFLFKDTDLYYSFLICADNSFEPHDQLLREKIAFFLINTEYIPTLNREKLKEVNELFFKVISNYCSSITTFLSIELVKKERVEPLILTLTVEELEKQAEMLSERSSNNEFFFRQLSINLTCVRSRFSELSEEHAIFVRDLIPSLVKFVVQKIKEHPQSENLVICSQQLIKFSGYFTEPGLIRELGIHVHEKRLIDAVRGKDNSLFGLDLDMYTILLGTYFNSSLHGPSALCSHLQPPNPMLWIELLKRGVSQGLHHLISQALVFCADKFIQPSAQNPHLLFYATFTAKLILGATGEDIPPPDKKIISPQLLERLLFFAYCHDSKTNFDNLLTITLMLSQDESLFFQAIQEGIKRQEEMGGYCFKMANIGLKLLLSNSALLSSAIKEDPEITQRLLKVALECPCERSEAGPFLKLFLDVVSKTPNINSDLPLQILEKNTRILENIPEFSTRTLGSVSFFAHALFPLCEEYSHTQSHLKVPKEILLRSTLPLIKFDAPSLLYLVLFVHQSKAISSSVKQFVNDLIAKIDDCIETPNFFPDESEVVRLTTLPKAFEVRERLRLYSIYLEKEDL